MPLIQACDSQRERTRKSVKGYLKIASERQTLTVWLHGISRLACADEWLPGNHKLPILAMPSDELVQATSESLARIAVPNFTTLTVSNGASKAALVGAFHS